MKVIVAITVIALLVAAAAHGTAGATSLSPCRISYPSDAKVAWKCYRLKKRDSLESLFGAGWQDVARFNRIDRRHALPGTELKVPVRLEAIREFSPLPSELEYPRAEKITKLILVDLSEQFLGAYQDGRLVFSFPITSGGSEFVTPPGEYRVTAFRRRHESSLYSMEELGVPYPMHYALQFFVDIENVAYWIHGRDLPGYPASHGCVGLYDEEMQSEYYGFPDYPLVDSARKLYEWAIAPRYDDGGLHYLTNGPRVIIIGEPPGGTTTLSNPAPGP